MTPEQIAELARALAGAVGTEFKSALAEHQRTLDAQVQTGVLTEMKVDDGAITAAVNAAVAAAVAPLSAKLEAAEVQVRTLAETATKAHADGHARRLSQAVATGRVAPAQAAVYERTLAVLPPDAAEAFVASLEALPALDLSQSAVRTFRVGDKPIDLDMRDFTSPDGATAPDPRALEIVARARQIAGDDQALYLRTLRQLEGQRPQSVAN